MLREEGITAVVLPDPRARELIRLVSGLINSLTDQWFSPVRRQIRVDGRGTPFAHLDNFIPIVKLYGIDVGLPSESTAVEIDMTALAHVRDRRYVEMLGSAGVGTSLAQRVSAGLFPPRRQPVFPFSALSTVLRGVYGWLEDPKEIETTTPPGAASGATTIELASITGWKRGDVAVFDQTGDFENAGNEIALVDAVLTGPPRIQVDPIEFAIPVGAKVWNFGRVPREIRRCAVLLVGDRVAPAFDDESTIEDSITSESTEGYSYSMSDDDTGVQSQGGVETSGNAEVDDVLIRFCSKKVYLGFV